MNSENTDSNQSLFHISLSLFVFVTVLACLLLQPGQAQTAKNVTVFEGARLITGDDGAPIEDSAFIVVDDRITHVGRRGVLNVP
jgi:hypothetical protein